jgi:hypothetical protein
VALDVLQISKGRHPTRHSQVHNVNLVRCLLSKNLLR